MESLSHLAFKLALVWALLFVCIGIPARMARARGRNPGHWVLVSLCGTPVLAIVLLLALDDPPPPPGRNPDA